MPSPGGSVRVLRFGNIRQMSVLTTMFCSLTVSRSLLTLPGHTVIRPGHDYGESPTSTIAREMEENIYITDFILEA
ncbi:MAG: hypothetical protein ACQEQ7_06240 [Thermodesulfobacteriota bacterium]